LAGIYLAVFGRKAFYRWNQLLLRVAARGMCVSDPLLKTIGPGEQTFLRRLGTIASPTVLDVGANVGSYSALLKEICPSARIWAFEPHPSTFRQLSELAASIGFTAFNMGLSDSSGSANLYDYAGNDTGTGSPHASLHRGVIEDLHNARSASIEVEVGTVDEVLCSQQIHHLNLLKIDAEGHELQILRGASNAIREGHVDIVQFEFNEMNVVSRVFFHDFYDVLPGFSFYRMVVDGLAPVGAYNARTHELYFLHNVVAIRDTVDYRSRLI
jgi:FkbM family methyltransferase